VFYHGTILDLDKKLLDIGSERDALSPKGKNVWSFYQLSVLLMGNIFTKIWLKYVYLCNFVYKNSALSYCIFKKTLFWDISRYSEYGT
jgi:hypothetical protein